MSSCKELLLSRGEISLFPLKRVWNMFFSFVLYNIYSELFININLYIPADNMQVSRYDSSMNHLNLNLL